MPEFINRPPRIQPELPIAEVDIPSPPDIESESNSRVLIQMALPLVTIIGYVIVSAMGQGRSLLLLIPMGLSVVSSTVLALFSFVQAAREERQKRAEYLQSLLDLRNEMSAYHESQRIFYRYNFPDPDTMLGVISGSTDNRAGSRLWERRTTDEDFGSVRLGIGTRPSTVTYKLANNADTSNALSKEAAKLADDSRSVDDIPITISLRHLPVKRGDDEEIDSVHALGIAGHNIQQVADFVRAMAVNFTALHAPNDARLYVIGSQDSRSRWGWARWLPHCNARNDSSTGDQLGFDKNQQRRLWDEVQTNLERRQLRLADKDHAGNVTIPFILLIIDALTADAEFLQEVGAEATVAISMAEGLQLGIAILYLVPDRNQIPSECKAVIEIDKAVEGTVFRYAEVGVNSPRFVGVADEVEAQPAEQEFARKLAPIQVQTGYGSDLARAIDLMEMNHARTMEDIPIMENWRRSREAKNAEWLHVPIGLMAGNKIRELLFAADGDGVHGMIAGTTGSGKSELLLTLITGLALTYDPSVVNFILVDYKGGSAFDPFKTLPHAVDILSNLQASATARTFSAIKAELNRRSKLIADTRTKHIVHYRQKNLHETREPFPFLFIIIDEFAEMVKEMPDVKAQLDSITRLGRALGVSLLLATQRPAGAITDQMRANMKFRICLRVETPEDSRELLRRSDAAFLPPNIPGRAYLQVGNENVELMQVARAGAPYLGPQMDTDPPVIWLKRPKAVRPQEGGFSEAPAMSDVLVDIMHRMVQEHSEEIPAQIKPYPDPLPTYLPLEAESIVRGGEPDEMLPLNPAMKEWLEGRGKWRGVDWERESMRANIGLIDNPTRAERLLFTLDLTRGHAVIFSSPGWGKTTFLRALIMGLAATHSPAELNVYALDFGGRGLDVLLGLPHFAASIMPTEEERVQRLMRRLGNELEERKAVLSEAQADNLITFNTKHPDKVIPSILVVIDNFAEFKENYEPLMQNLISIVRDGRSYGLHFVVTADQTSTVPGKLFSLFTERMTLKLADSSEYATIVGRGVPGIDDVEGRGFVLVGRTPLEFQIATPVGVTQEEEEAGIDEAQKVALIAGEMSDAWEGERPEGIDVLRPILPLRGILPELGQGKLPIQTILGLEDFDLKPASLDLQLRGPHFTLIGPPLSGKTTALRSWVLSLATAYRPEQVAMVLIDFQQRFFKYGGKYTLGDLPHVLDAISEAEQMPTLVQHLQAEYSNPNRPPREIFVIADNYDDFANVVGPATRSTVYKELGDLARKYGPSNLHFVLCGSPAMLRAQDELMKQVIAPRYGLGLDASDSPQALGGRVRSGAANAEFPPGRGYIVKSGRISMMQVATPYSESDVAGTLDQWIEQIRAFYPDRAAWFAPPTAEPAPAAAEPQPAK